jgi:hypothetical protein
MNDWPVWMRVVLKNDPAVLDILPAGENGIYAAGSLKGPPDKKPFLVVHTDSDARGPFPGMGLTLMSIHAHDEPGSYNRVRLLLHRARQALAGAALEQAVKGTGAEAGGFCRWLNDSADLADEGFKTIVRTSQYQLTGADGDD